MTSRSYIEPGVAPNTLAFYPPSIQAEIVRHFRMTEARREDRIANGDDDLKAFRYRYGAKTPRGEGRCMSHTRRLNYLA